VSAEALLLWWSSSQPGPAGHVPAAVGLLHNAAHVPAFAAFAVLAMMALGGRRPWGRRRAAVAFALACTYGLVDELHQRMVPGRACSVADLGADASGAALGLGLLCGVVAGAGRARLAVCVSAALALAAVGAATWTSW